MKRKDILKTYRFVGGSSKRVLLHRDRAERALGKSLPPNAIVHHADGSRSDDAPLVICQDDAYHKFLHMRMRIQAAGGNPNTDRLCCGCHLVKAITEFSQPRSFRNRTGYRPCRRCERQRRAKQRQAASNG